MDTNVSAAPGMRQRWWRGPRGEPSVALLWLTAVAPIALSLFSLALSVYAIIEGSREPEIWLSAPVAVKVAVSAPDVGPDGGRERARFYVQPRLVSAARNDRVAVISDLWLEVAASGGGPPVKFTWAEQGTWQYEPVGPTSTYYYLADPAPLVVGPSSPQLPICLFVGSPGWHWQAGTYEVTIVAARGPDAEPLRAAFTMTLPAESVEFISARPGQAWVKIDTQPANPAHAWSRPSGQPLQLVAAKQRELTRTLYAVIAPGATSVFSPN